MASWPAYSLQAASSGLVRFATEPALPRTKVGMAYSVWRLTEYAMVVSFGQIAADRGSVPPVDVRAFARATAAASRRC